MRIDLTGKRAFVTGANRGIGEAVARSLVEAGAEVFAGHRGGAATGEARCGTPFFCDLADSPRLPPGRLDLLVNNAGIWIPSPLDDAQAWEASWRDVFETNLFGLALLCREFALQAKPGAAIVNISSRSGLRGEPRYTAYSASKAAVHALTKSLATELGPLGVRVNAVAPGWVLTGMTEAALPAEGLPEPIPLGRVGEPADVAGPTLFLCSELARYVTGVVLDVCGGSYLR